MTRRRCALVVGAVAGASASPRRRGPIIRCLVRTPAVGRPWSLRWFLGASVFLVAFVATLAVFSMLERRQRAGAKARESTRRS